VLAFSEAGFGLVLLTMLVSYLPSIFQSFQRRDAAALLIRSSIIGGRDRLEGLWREWESWFVDVTEAHTSLLASAVDRPRSPDAELCIRAGYVALRRITDFFDVRHNPDPHWPQEPIPIDRREFDPAWRDFAGWRVNYDRVLLSLAALTIAPYAPWFSDRSMVERNGSRIRRHNRSRA